ncbi:MAG: nucleoside deaminase [Christensenellales bacterium]
MYDEKFMLRAFELAKEADKLDEVPVGAVIVKDGEIVAEGINRKERDLVATHHAEMVAIENAAKAEKNWWLEDCEIYVTLEPCPMCAMAILLSRIKSVYFGAYDPKSGGAGSVVNIFEKGKFNHNVECSGGYMAAECGKILSEYFRRKRKKN